ncbi:MAG: hypothetical protein IKL63_04920 [Alistipes sp.]|nr:hypothetical protein [Alistipes sp.]
MRKFYLFSLLFSVAIVACQTAYAQQSDETELKANILPEKSGKAKKMEYSLYFGASYLFDVPNTDEFPVYRTYYAPKWGYQFEFNTRVKLHKNIYLGGEFSMLHIEPRSGDIAYLNFNFAPSAKFVLPLKRDDVSLFANINLGATGELMWYWGFYMNYGIGIDAKWFSAMIGYRGYLSDSMSIERHSIGLGNSVYVQLGVRLGK